jgi:hypothetical protein
MARAHVIAGDRTKGDKHVKLAQQAGQQIKKKEDRDSGELKTI